jgi:hypothetical protein
MDVIEFMIWKNPALKSYVDCVQQAIESGDLLETEKAFNVLILVAPEAVNAAINHYFNAFTARGMAITRPCENKVIVKEIVHGS